MTEESKVVNPLEEALRKREQQKQEQEQSENSGNWGEYESAETLGLEDKKEKVFRILGNPMEVRQNPTDPKLILQSSVVKDDRSGYYKLNWPVVEKNGKYVPDPDWIVTKFYNKVNEGKWEKYPDGQLDHRGKNGKYVKYHQNTKIFSVIDNNAKEGEKFPKSFFPSKRVVMNVIDRHDSWCKDNKHSKLLTSKKVPFEITTEEGKKTIYFEDTGVPEMVWSAIMDHCKATGTLDIDLVVTKKSDDKKYSVFDITDYPKYVTEASFKIGSKDALTEEEKQYELYDLDKLYGVSSYAKVKKVMKAKFALCDSELGTNFVDELERLVKKEAEERASEVDVEQKEKDVDVPKKETLKVQEPVKEEVKANRRPSTKPVEQSSKVDIKAICETAFPYWHKLTEDEKSIMISTIVEFNGNIPTYDNSEYLGCTDENCNYPGTDKMTIVPDNVNTCPVCGITLSE